MKGNPKVIEELNKALREELTAINQYFLHAEMCENWGYRKLSEFIKKQSIGEMRHAESLLERILFLDGVPTMEPLKLAIGSNVRDMIDADLKLSSSFLARPVGGSAERRGKPRRLAGSAGASDEGNGLRTISIDADGRVQRGRSVGRISFSESSSAERDPALAPPNFHTTHVDWRRCVRLSDRPVPLSAKSGGSVARCRLLSPWPRNPLTRRWLRQLACR